MPGAFKITRAWTQKISQDVPVGERLGRALPIRDYGALAVLLVAALTILRNSPFNSVVWAAHGRNPASVTWGTRHGAAARVFAHVQHWPTPPLIAFAVLATRPFPEQAFAIALVIGGYNLTVFPREITALNV